MTNFSSYFNDILKRASEITQQRTSNIEKYAQVKRASGLSQAEYSGGYKQTANQPQQKFTGREIAQLKALEQQAKAINPNITDKLTASLKDISTGFSSLENNQLQTKFQIERAANLNNLLLGSGLFQKAANVNLANKSSVYVPGPNRNLSGYQQLPTGISEDNFNKLLENPTYYNYQTRRQEKVLSDNELKLLQEINKNAEAKTSLFSAIDQRTKSKNANATTAQQAVRNFLKTNTDLQGLFSTNRWGNLEGSLTEIEKRRYKTNFLEGLVVDSDNKKEAFLTKLNELKNKENTLLQTNLKNPYLSVIDLSGYKSLIADAKAQEESMFKNLAEYTNTATLGGSFNGGYNVQFNNIKSGYVDTAKKFGQLVYNSYSSAYNELEKAIQSAKINWDTMNKTKASTLSGLDAILSTIRSKTSASSAQHSLGDSDYNQLKRDLLNQQLERTTSFSGTRTPKATFISRPS
jgi:hypothetical protein